MKLLAIIVALSSVANCLAQTQNVTNATEPITPAKIIGGQPAGAGDYPGYVHSLQALCGGYLIHPQVFLTVRICTKGPTSCSPLHTSLSYTT